MIVHGKTFVMFLPGCPCLIWPTGIRFL
uniref:Uncharacterized protein n=1 Tax=Rhizophora mucronata TaxID=61149 RepID=A0A2P2PF69_RHIMU